MNPLSHVERQHVPVVGLGPRDVHEVLEDGVRTLVAHELRCEVEVVVVEEHRRLGLALELVGDRAREVLIDRDVPLVPRVVERLVEVRRLRQVPKVVVDEPQRRVGDHVVEPVVRLCFVCDETEAKRRAFA